MTDRDNADVKVVWKKIRDCKTANCERAFNYPGGTPNFTSAIMITKVQCNSTASIMVYNYK